MSLLLYVAGKSKTIDIVVHYLKLELQLISETHKGSHKPKHQLLKSKKFSIWNMLELTWDSLQLFRTELRRERYGINTSSPVHGIEKHLLAENKDCRRNCSLYVGK